MPDEMAGLLGVKVSPVVGFRSAAWLGGANVCRHIDG